MLNIDLHTHSIASPDGSLTAQDYRQMLQSGQLQAIAVTDHDTIAFAIELHKQVGKRIIVGEEITTTEGEIIGLFLRIPITPGLTPRETVRHIKAQKGLVYIPHPFETLRKGLNLAALQSIAADIDIMEIHNGRAYFRNMSARAQAWARSHDVPGAASSDTHGQKGWGRTYSIVTAQPTATNLPDLLKHASYSTTKVGASGLLYPKFNRLRKRLHYAQ
jgi:predicted metal-dependent phosphoesterase TrpH